MWSLSATVVFASICIFSGGVQQFAVVVVWKLVSDSVFLAE